jgi:hypothetical protein
MGENNVILVVQERKSIGRIIKVCIKCIRLVLIFNIRVEQKSSFLCSAPYYLDWCAVDTNKQSKQIDNACTLSRKTQSNQVWNYHLSIIGFALKGSTFFRSSFLWMSVVKWIRSLSLNQLTLHSFGLIIPFRK